MTEPVRTIDDGLDGVAALREIVQLADEWERAHAEWRVAPWVIDRTVRFERAEGHLAAAVRARRGA